MRKGCPGQGWVNAAEAARLFGVTPATFSNSYRKHVPAESVKQVGPRVWIYLPALIRAVSQREFERGEQSGRRKAAEDAGTSGGTDGGSKSGSGKSRKEELEAELLQIKLDEARREVVRVSELSMGFGRIADILRRTVEQVQRRAGNIAASIILEGFENAEAEMVAMVGGELTPSPPDPNEEHGEDQHNGRRPDAADAAAGSTAKASNLPAVRGRGAGVADGVVSGPAFPRLAGAAPRAAAG